MAFNLLVELPNAKVDWQYINKSMSIYKEFMDFFPIPNNKIFKKDYIGISISQPVSEEKKEVVIKVITKFLSLNYKVIELYSHKIFTTDNVKTLVHQFF